VSKKDYWRLRRARADEQSKARSEAKDRKARIEELWREINSGRLAPKDRTATDLAEDQLYRSLVELVERQRHQIEYLTSFQRDWERIHAYYPEQLENLSIESSLRRVLSLKEVQQQFIQRLEAEKKPKQAYDVKRRFVSAPDSGEIKYQCLRRMNYPIVPWDIFVFVCLDDIFGGRSVKMQKLQNLFGMSRNRFPKELPSVKKGRETWYDYRAVVIIMDALLSEQPRRQKTRLRGRSLRHPWLSNPRDISRVFSAIRTRMRYVAAPEEIVSAFLALLHRHRPGVD